MRRTGQTVGVPTYNRYDKLGRLVQSLVEGSVWPERLVVLDNGGALNNAFYEVPFPVEVVTPGYNLGVSAAWNVLCRLSKGKTVVVNDDFVLAKDALERLDAIQAPAAWQKETKFACFQVTKELRNRIGDFDEGFWPANYEDWDCERRMALIGMRPEVLEESLGEHTDGYSSQREEGQDGAGFERSAEFTSMFARNKRRFAAKWAGAEPWQAREGIQPDELEWTFEDYRHNSPDIGLFFDGLRWLALQDKRIVELGTGSGRSGIAFLAGRPKSFVSCDVVASPSAQILYHLGGSAEVKLEKVSSLELEPREADLLFVDTEHKAGQLEAELRRHAGSTRKHILLHDTVAFGNKGTDGGPGLRVAVGSFLGANPEWQIAGVDERWPGLMLLERKA